MARERTPEQWRTTINHTWPKIKKVICRAGYYKLKDAVEADAGRKKPVWKPDTREITLISRSSGRAVKLQAHVAGDPGTIAKPYKSPGSRMGIPPYHAVRVEDKPLNERQLYISYNGKDFFRTNKRVKNALLIELVD